jgi:CheY-like chemotaxis protein
MPRLVVISESHAGLSYELGNRWVTIGRSPGNALQIVDSSVSGQHCEVVWRGNELLVRDMRSTNGTYIKETLVTQGTLGMGEILRVGEIELRLESSSNGGSLAMAPLLDRSAPAAAATNGHLGVRKRQLLLVDDSMAFLELAAEVFDSYANGEWEIHTACGADEALTAVEEHQIELAVLDISMPMLDGMQLLTMLHRRHPEVKLVILTGIANEAHRTQCLAAGAELYLGKPITRDGMRFVFNVLKDLITWKQREGFSGTLQRVCLTDIIQIECLRRNSCVLEIHTTRPQGEIYIESGVIIHAVTSTLLGEQALFRLLSLSDGQFHSRPFRQPAEQTVNGSWECLLMESARRHDEARDSRAEEKTTIIRRSSTESKSPSTEILSAGTKSPPSENKSSEALEQPELGKGVVAVSTYDGSWNPEKV